MSAVAVAPNTIVVFSDLLCPFAHVALHRLWQARAQLGLEPAVRFDHRAFPLELFNGPHLFLPDGTSEANPGISVHWEGPWASGYPIVDCYDPTVYDDLIKRAASTA